MHGSVKGERGSGWGFDRGEGERVRGNNSGLEGAEAVLAHFCYSLCYAFYAIARYALLRTSTVDLTLRKVLSSHDGSKRCRRIAMQGRPDITFIDEE